MTRATGAPGPATSAVSEADLDTMSQIASLYFLQDITQDEIARRYDTSRSRVSRVLKRARELGIVDIQVRASPTRSLRLEAEFRDRFGLGSLISAPDQDEPDAQRTVVSAAVASFLDRTLVGGMTVAVGMGRSVAAITDAAGSPAPRNVTFTSAVGGVVDGSPTLNPDHIARRLASRFGGTSETLYAPAVVATRELHEALVSNDTVRRTLDRARNADVALIGLGDLSDDSNLRRMRPFTPRELARARKAGTVGDVMGHDFIGIDGRRIEGVIDGRVVGLTLDDLQGIDTVVALASGSGKVEIILGALRTGTIDVLATSLATACAVLELDDGTRTRSTAEDETAEDDMTRT